MDAVRRVVSFGAGGVVGFLVGAAVSALTAPQTGEALRQRLAERAQEVKAAGDAAQAAVEARLIERFRDDVDDPQALTPESEQAKLLRSRALAALGLGLGAQGAWTAEQLRERLESTERG